MITIDQLLESVDLDFEPRWVTKNKDGEIFVWAAKPTKGNGHYVANPKLWCLWRVNGLKLAEFENKPWTECIYEVSRKATGKMNRLKPFNLSHEFSAPAAEDKPIFLPF